MWGGPKHLEQCGNLSRAMNALDRAVCQWNQDRGFTFIGSAIYYYIVEPDWEDWRALWEARTTLQSIQNLIQRREVRGHAPPTAVQHTMQTAWNAVDTYEGALRLERA